MRKTLLKCVSIMTALALSCTLDTAAQGRSKQAPGRSGGAPGNSGNAPGHNKGNDAPGRGHGKGHDKGGKAGVPIDGGATLLLAAGAAYGLKKMRDHRNSTKIRAI